VPYRDLEARKAYQREYQRLRRAGSQTPRQPLISALFRLKAARDIVVLLEDQIDAVRHESEADTLAKARAIGYLAGVALKAVEVADLAGRVEVVERIVKCRKPR
jgi:hypothetical protein